jgi:hypothetical protein
VTVNDQAMTVTLTGAPADISFIGQDGKIRAKGHGLSASYSFTPADSYIRTKVESGQSLLLLNPVMRSDTDNDRPRMPALDVDGDLTWLARGAILAACAIAAFLLLRLTRPVLR